MQKMQATSGAVASPPPSLHSPQLPPTTIAAGSANFNPNPYNLAPMMQMGMGINVGGQFSGNQQGLHQQTQAMHQSVMRHPSPGPSQQGQGQQGQGQGQGQGGYTGY